MKKILFGVVFIIVALFVTGCINYNEEAWLNSNGSGKIKMEISINSALMNMGSDEDTSLPYSEDEIKKQFTDNKNLKLNTIKTFSKDDSEVIQIEFEFNSIKDLEALKNTSAESTIPGFLGQISLEKDKKGLLNFSRTLEFDSPNSSQTQTGSENESTGSEFSAMGEQMATAMFSNYKWKYTIHFPFKIVSANTADEFIDQKTNTVKWEFSLVTLNKKAQKMEVVLRPYNTFEQISIFVGSMGIWFGVTIVVLVGLFIVLFLSFKKAARRQ